MEDMRILVMEQVTADRDSFPPRTSKIFIFPHFFDGILFRRQIKYEGDQSELPE